MIADTDIKLRPRFLKHVVDFKSVWLPSQMGDKEMIKIKKGKIKI